MYALFYGDGFKKDFIAGFARVLAGVARDTGDAFCCEVFRQAGAHLGSFARTLAPHLRAAGAGADPDVHGFTVVCVGSVWKSWDLLRAGFVAAATAPFHHLPGVPRAALAAMSAAQRGRIASFRLVRLTRSSAVGAAWMAARRAGIDMPLDCDAAVEVLYSHPSPA
jgi:N-acetylglucosamine kinase